MSEYVFILSLVFVAMMQGCVPGGRTMTNAELVDFDKQWNYSDAAASEATFRSILSQTVDDMPQSYRLALMTQLARSLGVQSKFGEAHEVLDDVEAELDGQSAMVRVRYLLERGRVFNSSKRWQWRVRRSLIITRWTRHT